MGFLFTLVPGWQIFEETFAVIGLLISILFMKKNLLILSIISLTVAGASYAQQDMLLTHFMYNKMMFNPGETGIDEGICANLTYRNQWDKVNGAPNSAVLNVEGSFGQYGIPGGVGLTFTHDAIGFSRQNNLLLNYAYHVETSAGKLGVGIGLGIVNFGMSPSWVPPTTINDAALPTGFAATNLDLNFGVYFKGSQIPFYAGLSSTHLSAPRLDQNGTFAGNNITQSYQTARHYYLMGGYTFQSIGGTAGDIDVQTIMRTELVKFSADINARYIYDQTFYGGLTYRTSDAVAFMLGYMASDLGTIPGSGVIGYSYDLTLNKLSNISRGSHEIFLKYCYYLPPLPVQKSKHPRWL